MDPPSLSHAILAMVLPGLFILTRANAYCLGDVMKIRSVAVTCLLRVLPGCSQRTPETGKCGRGCSGFVPHSAKTRSPLPGMGRGGRAASGTMRFD
jgi:hypothetical protein